jgi:FixJ family two-component response regulator
LTELRGRYDLLAHREHKVLELVVTGLLNKQIADKLGTCETTIKIHRGHVMRKCEPDRRQTWCAWQNDWGMSRACL